VKIAKEQRVDLAMPARRAETELPEGWAMVRLADVVQELPNVKPEDEADREFGYVDISAICNGTHQILDHRRFKGKDAPSRARRPIRPADVLFSNVRTYLRNVAIVPSLLDAQLCSTGFTVLRSNGAINPHFLFRYVLTDDYIDRVTPQQTGTHYPATSDRVVLGESIPLPPLAEQRRIVAKVEALLARVNAARQRLAKVPAILKRFRQAVLAAACSGRLTADWREEQTELKPPQGSPEGLEDLPDSWAWATFGDLISELRNGISTKPNPDPPGHPILRISSTRSGRVLLDDIRYLPNADDLVEVYGLRDRDLLFTRYNGSLELLGVCGMVRGLGKRTLLYPDKLMRVRIGQGKLLPEYVEAFFGSPQARDRIEAKSKSSAGQQGVSGADIKGQRIAVPPPTEQHEIVRRVEAVFRLADAIEKRVAAATARAEKLMQAVLAKAFRGELVPTEAELARREGRSYEPAAALLERIRAERQEKATASTGERKPRRRAKKIS
jgi:type I restriction enzyme S subunit